MLCRSTSKITFYISSFGTTAMQISHSFSYQLKFENSGCIPLIVGKSTISIANKLTKNKIMNIDKSK